MNTVASSRTLLYTTYVRPPFRPHGTTRLPLDGFSWNLLFEYFFGNLARKIEFHYNLTSIMGTLLEDVSTFMTISLWILLRMRNVSDKSCREFKTHILCSIFFFVSPENLAGYERMLNNKNRVGHKMTIWRMRIACWIPKATNTHSQYVILIALPQQQCLHERASLLGYRHMSECVNTYCLFTAGLSTRTRLNFTLYLHCLSSHLLVRTVYINCVFLYQIHCVF